MGQKIADEIGSLMDRRNFIRGLIGSAVALSAAPVLLEEVSRVYSFPTNIVCANSLQQCLKIFYDHRFVEKLRVNTAFISMGGSHPLPRIGAEYEYKMYMYVPTQVEIAT